MDKLIVFSGSLRGIQSTSRAKEPVEISSVCVCVWQIAEHIEM